MTQFISVCSSLNQIEYANLAVAQMQFPNVIVYNSLIRGVIDWGRKLQALKLYMEMLSIQIRPTSYTLSPLIKACSQAFALQFGESLHCHAWKMGFDSHVFVLTALVGFYGKLGRLVEARKVFDEMPERDSFAWSTVVAVHARAGDMATARHFFHEMPEKKATAWNTMIDGYAKLGNVESAEFIFNQMYEKDLVSWTTMIACYTQNKEYKKALAAFDDMMKSGIHPDKKTLTIVVSCCAHLGALDLGNKIYFFMFQEGLSLDVYVGCAMVDMYAKCGKLDRAMIIFLNLKEKNLFCWNSIIEGLAAHGHEIKHYGCMVDLLCKAKLLEDALELIGSMKIEPNSVIWGALLSGCKLCQNIEIAEIAFSKLMELKPDNCGYYSMLLGMYAEANRWNKVRKIRAIMRELGVEKKCPGSSWIELGNELHQFVAADSFHPASTEICALLDELYGQLKPACISL